MNIHSQQLACNKDQKQSKYQQGTDEISHDIAYNGILCSHKKMGEDVYVLIGNNFYDVFKWKR